MRSRNTGPTTFLVLKKLADLPPDECYGGKLFDELKDFFNEEIGISQLYVILKRLQTRGHVTVRQGKSPVCGFHKIKLYSLTVSGERELADANAFYRKIGEYTS